MPVPADPALLAFCLIGSVLAGLAIFYISASYYHIRYYVFRRDDADSWKNQPNRWLKPAQQRKAALMSSGNLILGGLISGSLIYAITQGMPTPLYFEVADYGWPYTIASGVLLFVLNDGSAYYVHRLLHHKRLFRHFHRHHHRFVATSPWVTTAVHPIELVMMQGAAFLPLFFIPFHPMVIGSVLVYILLFNVIDHSGVKLTSDLPWQGPTTYHDDHHAHFHVNFGQHLMIWDRIHGTLRRPDRTYGEDVFGGKGKQTRSKKKKKTFAGY